MAKRPTGFGKASKEKKLKHEEPPAENSAELNIELTGDVDDEELAEVYGLYTKLQEERDPKIARGLIHECDQMLRTRDSQNQGLPDKFHVVYGGALLTLADPAHEEEHKQFRDVGVERINVGLTSANEETVALAVRELLQYVHTQVQNGELTSAGQKILKHAISLLKKRQARPHIELGRAAVSLLQILDDMNAAELDGAAQVAFDVLNAQIAANDAETKRWGHKGLGQYFLNLAAPALEEEDPEDTGELKEQIKNAVSHLKHALSDSDQETYVMLAETLLELAGLTEVEDEEEKLYAEALKHLKKARLLGNDGLNEVIDSLESGE